jgi:iron(III) transport system permease protein
MLAISAALIATFLAILFNSQQRFVPDVKNQTQLSLSSLGYAIPGTVLAIGILIPLGQLDVWVNALIQWLGFEKVGLIFSGTSFALILAFVIRFSAISNGSIQAAYKQMPTNLDAASTMLKASRFKTFRKIHLPIMQPALISAFLLVFIECVKELPASLLLRPFDFETLATYVYQFASDEQLEHAASSALLIVVISLLPILLLTRNQKMQ